MFKPNLVATPVIHTDDNFLSVATFAPALTPIDNGLFYQNVINNVPAGDFGRNAMHWAGTASFVGGNKIGIGQQFTVTTPQDGDAVGVEVNGSIFISTPAYVSMQPQFGRLVAPGANQLSATQFNGLPTNFGDYSRSGTPGSTAIVTSMLSYKEQFVIRATDPGGIYGHGFSLLNDGATFNITYFFAVFSVRQLNDQQNVGYRDTRR